MNTGYSRKTTAGVLDFRRVQHGVLALDGDFEPGVYVLLGDQLDGLSQLLELTLGTYPPQRGEIRVAGTDPSCHPATRRRIGSVLWQETVPRAEHVQGSVELLLQLHGEPSEQADRALRQLELQHLSARAPGTLTADERRGVMLAVALALRQPLLLALASPLSIRCVNRQATLARLHALREHTVALIATTDASEAAELGGLCLLFVAGRIVSRTTRPEAPPGAMASLTVTSDDSARLARLLTSDAAVASLEAPLGGDTLVIHGPELDQLSLTLLRVAEEHDILLHSLSQRVPSPHELWRQRRTGQSGAGSAPTASSSAVTTPLAPAPSAANATPPAPSATPPAPSAANATPPAPSATPPAPSAATPAADSRDATRAKTTTQETDD